MGITMGMDWEIDLGGKTAEQIEKEAGKLPAGYYYAKFTEDEDSDKDGSKTLHFVLSRGGFMNRKINVILKHPRMAEDAKKAQDAANRMAAIATRMGAISPGENGRAKTNFKTCAGREYILKVVHREGKDGGMFSNIDYYGVYPAEGHDDIPNKERESLGLPLKGKSAGASAGGSTTAGQGAGAAPVNVSETAKNLWS